MYKNKKILGLITARGGSKGLPGKNIIEFSGKPLIAWTINCAKQSKYIDTLIVSTDDENIARVSESFGAEVPFIRPSHLASDTAASADVVLHAIEFLKKNNKEFEYVCLLEPTSPLREPCDIDAAVEQLVEHPLAQSIVGIANMGTTHPEFSLLINDRGLICGYHGESKIKATRRQDLEPVYYLEGTVYISTVSALKEENGFYHEKTAGYLLPKEKAIEIDDQYDLIMAEALMNHRING